MKAMAKDKKKKLIIAVSALSLLCVAALTIGGINAYLTDTETVANTFTIGEVTIEAMEPNYPGNGSDATEDLLPLEEVPKDPCIRNTGKNRIVAFIQVEIPMAEVTITDDNGNRLPKTNVELFGYRTKAGSTDGMYNCIHSEKWIPIEEVYLNEDDEDVDLNVAAKVRRTYGYKTVLEENETTVPVFDIVRFANIVEGPIDNSVQTITVTSYAIQADNIAGITSDNWTDEMDEAKLTEIFDAYLNQSAGKEADDADNSNNQTLRGTTLNVSMTVLNRHLKLNTGDDADTKTTIMYNVAYTGKNEKPVPTFESSNTDVVTVDNNGNITAVGVGTATITMRATNPDNQKEVTAETIVTVRDVNAGF